jgi:hypothetical protein
MAYRHRESKPPFDIDEARRLYDELKSYRKVARQLDSNYAAVYRALILQWQLTGYAANPTAPRRL